MARRKGEGRIFLRGKTWYMRWRCNGMEMTRSTGVSADEHRARERAESALREVTEVFRLKDRAVRLEVVKAMVSTVEERLRGMQRATERVMTLGDLPREFEASARRIDCSEAMLAIYRRYAELVAGLAGEDTPVADVDGKMAESLARRLGEGVSPNTYNKRLNGLSVVWRAVMESAGVSVNPWDGLPRRRLDTRVRRALTEEETERLLSVAEGEMRRLVAIGLYTGLRLGDAAHLSWSDIRDGAVFVRTAKTGAKVAIPLHPRLAEMLGPRHGDGPVVPGMAEVYDGPGRDALSAKVGRLFRKCGIATSHAVDGRRRVAACGFHSLRHTFVSRCVACGVPTHAVQAIVGHSSAAMTERYTHLSDDAVLAAFSAMR